MKPEPNCSSRCDSARCSIHAGVSRSEGLDVLLRLCSISTMSAELPRRSLSPILCAVVWTLLSVGILLSFCFLLFTLRFKNNRIVKMSSPNLNVLTLLGSLLAYISAFLFAADDRMFSQAGAPTAVIQARMWTLCIGSSMVFGPILGKTWRLYRVFTQRLPDKRVIIRDIQLMGMVALLILVDLLLLSTWNLSDPIRCSRSVGAAVKVVEREIFYSLSQMDSCSSVYADLWAVIIAVEKGGLLLYGTYLAGLTSNVSHPPVNQSPTIITAITLVTMSLAVVVPVSIFLQAWPNLVYSAVAGAIFICTSATNCMLFVPQLTQWRQFEEDQNNPGQMAKYFSSPSKSQPSVYSQDEICFLLGENNSMKRLLNEKNVVIDSLQEQVNNAKDKLLRLMSASQTCSARQDDLDSSATNLNSSSTQTTELQSEGPSSSSLPRRERPSAAAAAAATVAAEATSPVAAAVLPPPSADSLAGANRTGVSTLQTSDTAESRPREVAPEPVSLPNSTTPRATEDIVSLQCRRGLQPFRVDTSGNGGGLTSLMSPMGFVSSEQLQEILQELSVETSLRSPSRTARTPSHIRFREAAALSPLSLRTARSPRPPAVFHYPRISPYAMRKRRPPFTPSRRGLSPTCFYTEACEKQHPLQNHVGVTGDGTVLQTQTKDSGLEEGEKEENIPDYQRCSSTSRMCPSLERDDRVSPDAEASAGDEQHRRHLRDSCGYWDSDSSSSTDYGYYHRPYCDSCRLQRGPYLSSDSSSDSSDSESEGFYRSSHPVVFKEDLKPTFV